MTYLKKLILLFVMLFPFVVSASEYSEWSIEYPDVENVTIKTEERFLYYEMVETNVEYKKYGESNRSNVDLNDYKLTEGVESDEEVEETEYTVVTKSRKALDRYYDDVSYVKITHDTDSSYGLRIKDITLIDEDTNKKVSYELESFNNIVILNENDYLIYTGGNILLKLDTTYNAYNLSISYTIQRDNNDTETKNFLVEYLHTYQFGLIPNFELRKNLDTTQNCVLKDIPQRDSDWWIRVDYYDVYYYIIQEKLFKYYDLERKDIGYYTYLEGDYLKDDEPVTFYSYKEKESVNNEEIKNKEETTNKTQSNNEVESTDLKQTIEYNCEYLNTSSFPIDTNDNITDYSVNILEKEDSEEMKQKNDSNDTDDNTTNSLISYNTESCSSCTSYKNFALISLISIFVLILIILINSLIKRIKTFND